MSDLDAAITWAEGALERAISRTTDAAVREFLQDRLRRLDRLDRLDRLA